MLTIQNIQPKAYKRSGITYNPTESMNDYHAEIKPGREIRIFGTYRNHINGAQQFDKTFKVGDVAEYGSYNLVYTGEIVSIGKKTISIHHHGEVSRLSLYEFSWRNWDFNIEKINKHNIEESYCI
jgi:hypothetical protein